MVTDFIQNKLNQKLNQKKQQVVKLRWQEAELRQLLDRLKRAQEQRQEL